ncbi:MAG TPA: hypothetical protein VFE28_06675 [Candidatus Krumholzibacteria bacterium]|nr:hypothetical protein [Candidatus Krumholzibacteria bacterium]
MVRIPLLALLGLVLASAVANAGLSTSFRRTGKVALEVAGAAGGNAPIASGTLTLSRLPASATVLKATLYASQVNNGAGLSARFSGVDLGPTGPAASDAVIQVLYSYEWDVTSLVLPGKLGYTYSVFSGSAIAGVALAVVWEDINEPTRIVVLVDGMRQVGEIGAETESTSIDDLGHGNTTISIFTVLDDTINTGEIVAYNGVGIGGPIDDNLGLLASLLQLEGESVTGTNTVSIVTGTDHMGWMIAGVSVTMPSVPVSPTTWTAVKSLFR